jgi:hypothetical protein
MEVHHHGHHEGKKTWKSYIWEFLMLFLAVFCGFMAEWQLEHVIEHQREKEYMRSIVEDIKEDVVQTDKLLNDLTTTSERLDSLLVELSSEGIYKNSNKACQLWTYSLGFPDFINNDRTIQQLKSSGALRLIRIKAVSDSIMKYDQTVRQIYITQNDMNSNGIADQTFFNQFFDFINLEKQSKAFTPIPLTEKGKTMVNEAYANRLFRKKRILILKRRIYNINQQGKNVANFIKSQYHFTDL